MATSSQDLRGPGDLPGVVTSGFASHTGQLDVDEHHSIDAREARSAHPAAIVILPRGLTSLMLTSAGKPPLNDLNTQLESQYV